MAFFDMENKINPESVSPIVWAYIGDAIYELYIRTMVISKGLTKVNQLHNETVKYVKASAQASFMHEIIDKLTPDEINIMKKGRNAKSTVPRKTEVMDYRYSTGLESLLGYLYLQDNQERMQEILQMVQVEKNL